MTRELTNTEPKNKLQAPEQPEAEEKQVPEQTLCFAGDNLKNAFEAMEDGVYIVDRHYNIQFANHAVIKDFGDYEGKKCFKYFRNQDDICPWCNNSEAHAEKTLRWEWFSPKRERTYDLIDTPLKNPDGDISRLGIYRDITEQKEQDALKLKINQQQEELKRLKSLKTMAGAIAHRFNNSMTAVLGNLELLEMTVEADAPGRENIAYALDVTREASQIGSMMLTYVGQMKLQRTSANLVDIVRTVVVELKSQFLPSISLKFGAQPEPLYCVADGLQIKAVIRSVLINAIESLPASSGTIEITFGSEQYATSTFPTCFQNDDIESKLYSFCQISDSGAGIKPEDISRICEPFFTTKFIGRGLGLALSVGILQAHQGALTVESLPEQGTTMRILLPSTT